MKKRILSIANNILLVIALGGIGGGMLASCDMDVQPEGAIPDTEALVSTNDFETFANGLNALMRSITSGDFVVLSDVQLDDFNAVIGNGNRRMEFYNGQVQPSTGEIGSIYAGYYSVIAQTNFFIEHVENKLKENLTNKDAATLQKCAGQAYFFRAYCYSCLADKFCQSYIHCADRDKAGTGLSLQLVYAPTADNSKYPGRSSLKDTYDRIITDLTTAYNYLKEAEDFDGTKPAAESVYPHSDAAKAMMARVCLNMGNNSDAAKYAVELIKANNDNNITYPLIRMKKAFYDMWRNDTGSEIIWKVSADYTYHGSASGDAFCNNDQNPDYVPTNDAIYLFDENDYRWYAWFDNDDNDNTAAKQKTISNSGGTEDMFLFAKYPGNPKLQPTGASGSNFVNMGKPLRIGEMYLIAAEAYAKLGDEKNACTYLNDICSVRNAGVNANSLSGTELMEAIYDERHRELMGEGLRQADLKRWNIGFTRSDAFEGRNSVIISNFRNIQYSAGDYRLTWPIPQHEMDTNPQLAGQQNPGY